MEKWIILGINQTKDEEAIKAAYKLKLKTNHPEDNPEGFKALRKAYDEAITYARSTEEPKKESQYDDSPLGMWMKNIETLYDSFNDRINPEKWLFCFKDEVFMSLETRESAVEMLLAFLMEHHFLPSRIWKVIDSEIGIKENREELKEKFQDDFLDYIINNCEYNGIFDYYGFKEHDDELPYDEYIKCFFKMSNSLGAHDAEAVKNALALIEGFELHNVSTEILKSQYYTLIDEMDMARAQIEKTIEAYPDNRSAIICYANIIMGFEEYQAAYDIFKKYSEGEQGYVARCGMADALVGLERYSEAQKIYKELLMERHYDGYVHYRLTDCNNKLVNIYKEKIAADDKDIESYIELCWCYYQNNQPEEAYDVIGSVSADSCLLMDITYLKARCEFNMNKYQQASEHFYEWIGLFDIYRELEGKVGDRNRDREELVYYFLSEIAIYQKDYDEALRLNKKSFECVNKEKADNDIIVVQKANIYIKLERFNEAIEILEGLLHDGYDNMQALIFLGDCYKELGMIQNAVMYYERAIYLIPYLPEGYAKLIKLFIDAGYEESAEEYLKQFRAGEVESDAVNYCEFLLLRNKGDYDAAYEIIKKLDEIKDDPDTDLFVVADRSDFVCDITETYLEMNVISIEEALENIRLIIDDHNIRYRYYYSTLLFDAGRYSDAEVQLKTILKAKPENEHFLMSLARVYNQTNNSKEVEILKRIYAINPHNSVVNGKLGDYYAMKNKYKSALLHYDKQLEIEPSSYIYVGKGIVLMDTQKHEEALECFRLAIEKNPQNPYAYYNYGRELMRLGECEKAVDYLNLAVENSRDNPVYTFDRQLLRCYTRLNAVDKAEAFFEELKEKYRNKLDVYYLMARFYLSNNMYEKGIELLELGDSLAAEKNPYFKVQILRTMMDYFDIDNAEERKRLTEYFEEVYDYLKEDGDDLLTEYYRMMGMLEEQYREYKRNPVENDAYYYHMLGKLCIKLSELKKNPLAKKKLKAEAEEAYSKAKKIARVMLETSEDKMEHYKRLCLIAIDNDEIRDAEAYLKKMKKSYICDYCMYEECYEYYTAYAYYKIMLGEYREAKEALEKARKICRDDFDISLLEKMIKQTD